MLHSIPRSNLDKLTAEIARINKRAVRLGCPEITIQTVRTWVHTIVGVAFDRKVEMLDVEVVGEAPVIAGYTFAGVLDHLAELPVLRILEGFEPPVNYRQAKPVCDHCHTVRNRKATYLLVHTLTPNSDEWVQVGSGCLADFTGSNDPHKAADYCGLLLDLQDLCREAREESWGETSGQFSGWNVEKFFAWTAKVIREVGWMPRSKADEFAGKTATSEIVLNYLCKLGKLDTGSSFGLPTDQDEQTAQGAIAWTHSLDPMTCSDYLANCHAVVEQGYVPLRHVGIAASIVATYQKQLAERSQFVAGHFGEAGKRETFTLTLIDHRTIPGVGYQGGFKTLCRFKDASGRLATWWATGSVEGLPQGIAAQYKATVKRHSNYKGQDQTDLSRVTLIG